MLEKLVRFDIAKAQGALILDEDLARIFKRSSRYLNVIRKKASYIAKRMELTTGIPAMAEETVELTIARQRQYLKEMMPSALRVVADIIQSKPTDAVGRRLQTQMALEVLDREGSFPKISRTDVHQKIEHDFAAMDGVSKALLEAMDGVPQRENNDDSILEAIKANTAFSNSDTLSSEQQEVAMTILESMPPETESIQ
jgi:hypothetical protein